jgi:hypothetical protein
MTLIKDGSALEPELGPVKRLSKAEAAVTPPDETGLPPAGDARRDALKARTDHLQQAAESINLDKEALDPSRYRPIREVQHMLAESVKDHPDCPISGALSAYEYCLVRFKEPGSQVEIKLTQDVYDTKLGVKVPVWEVVQGSMPEMAERKDIHGYRVIADTLLMRGRKDRVAAWRDQETYQANRHAQRQQADLLDQARRTRGIRVTEVSMPDPDGLTVTPGSMRDALAKQLGAQLVTDRLKSGTQPGMEVRS